MTTTKEPEETGKAGKTGKSAKNTAKKDAKAAKQEPDEKPLTLEEVRAVLAENTGSSCPSRKLLLTALQSHAFLHM